MMRFLSSLAIFLTIASASGNRCSLSDPIEIDTNLFLEQRRYDDETFTMRLTYTGGRSWIGIGMIEGGIGKPAAAVIGRVDNVTSVESVEKYGINTRGEDGSGIVPMASFSQTLMDATFEQTESTSTLTFTKYLNEEFCLFRLLISFLLL